MGPKPSRKFETAKSGNRPGEREDVSWDSYPYNGELPARISVCDGATESAFAKEWAQILSEAFVHRPMDLSYLDNHSLSGWLSSCQEEWNRAVPWERIPWHGEAKTRAGAMSTLLGLEIAQTTNSAGVYSWKALAVGDGCLFVVRQGALAVSFPIYSAAQFGNTPSLICSNPANNGGLWQRVHQLRGECLPGDLIILASDALACWILQERESGSRPWETLQAMGSDAEWQAWVQARRSDRSMRNDDTSLIIIEVV